MYHWGIFTVLGAVLLSVERCHASQAFFGNLQSQFSQPGTQYRPSVFWHWINGNVATDGIDKDVEALFNSGYGSALFSSVNAGMPPGPIQFNSDEWLAQIVYAAEKCREKGMQLAMHNAPGYSGIGSPDLPINMTMKELVWTETRIPSNTTNGTILQQPFNKLGLYQDLYVLAYPVQPGEGTVFRDAVANVSVTGTLVQTNITSTINLQNPLRLPTASDYLQFDMQDFFTAQGVAIYRIPEIPLNTFDGARDYPPSWKLLVSNNSITWTTVTLNSGTFPALRQMDAPATLTFPPTVAKHFRLQPNGPSWVTGVDIASGSRLRDWGTKSHAAPGSVVANPASLPVAASVIDPPSILDLTSFMDNTGKLNWKPGNGTYTVVRFGYTATGQNMPATPDDAYSLSVDLFSTEAIDAHFTTHLDRVIAALKPYIPETFFGFEDDSYELGMQNWGGNLAADFEEFKGYSLVPWLLAATGRIINSTETTEQFLYDFRSTHAYLTATKSYGYFNKRLAENGLVLLTEPYGDGPFDSYEVAAQAAYAYGEMWAHYTYGSDGYTQLGAMSTDLHGTRVTFQEAFTGHPFTSALTEHPYSLKAQGDREISLGSNKFFFHEYAHQPVDAAFPGMMFGPFGTHFSRQSTYTEQLPGWLTHLSRTALLLQNGDRQPDVACFSGEEMNDGPIITYNAPYNVPLSYQSDPFGYAGLETLIVKNGRAAYSGAASSYGLLVFPAMPAASVKVLNEILALAQAGVPILLQPIVPSRSISLNGSDSEVVAIAAQLWGLAGNGKVFVGNATTAVLTELGIQPDLTFTSSSNDAAIYFAHNLVDGEDVYFISNGLRKPVDVTISLRATTGTPEIWDPQTGELHIPPAWSVVNGRTVLGLTFTPSQSIFVRLSQGLLIPFSGQISSLQRNGEELYSVESFPPFNPKPYANVSSSFTISVWAKPEAYLYANEGFIVYPPISSAYGTDHSAVGIVLGTQQLLVTEASTSTPATIITLNQEFSGWTHLALVYNGNAPSIFVNGVLDGTAAKSNYIVHPGVGTPDSVPQMTVRFSGDIAGLTVYNSSLNVTQVNAIYSLGLPLPDDPPAAEITGDNELLIRQNGNYSLVVNQKAIPIPVTSVSSTPINSTWTVTFPSNRLPKSNPNLSIQLTKLQSLHLHPDFDVAHFSGTATYTTTFINPRSILSIQPVLLNLGRVENIAEITVNGKYIGLSWLPPYEVDISSALFPGENTLSIAVTNLWPNRIIGDEFLPVEDVYNTTNVDWAVEAWPEWWVENKPVKDGERVTFSSWHHYNATGLPLLASGLLGPVKITVADKFPLLF